jgi:Avidin family
LQHEKALSVSPKPMTAVPAPSNFSGQWKNQYGSSMDLVVSSNVISGTYNSAVSAGGGSVSGTLRGFVAGDLLSFCALWPNGSMTAWVGQIVDDAVDPRIKTLWHLVTDARDPNEATDIWATVLAGADEFIR